MLNYLRHLRHYIIILTIITFLFGFGGNSAHCYCFMPDGNVHSEQGHSVCRINGERSFNEGKTPTDDARALSQDYCLHVTLERNTTDHLHRNLTRLTRLPATTIPLGAPITLTQTEKSSFRNIPAVVPPLQLVTLQSVVLLI